MPNVYVVNKCSHDFTRAKEFGKLVYLSEGAMNRYGTNHIHCVMDEVLKDSNPEDYILPCSMNIMNVIACSIFAAKHGRINLLLYKNGKYIERNVML